MVPPVNPARGISKAMRIIRENFICCTGDLTARLRNTEAPKRTQKQIKSPPKVMEKSKPSKILLFNKPFDTLCQFTGEPGDSTLADYIDCPGVYPAGRLDKDSEGLLVLTNDGRLQHRIANPANKMAKTYWAQVEGLAEDTALEPLRQGIRIRNYQTLPARVAILPEPAVWPRTPPIRERQHIPTSWLEITLREGKNRQVRRMTAAVGLPTLRLIRVRIGDWDLEGLLPGQYRSVAPVKASGRL